MASDGLIDRDPWTGFGMPKVPDYSPLGPDFEFCVDESVRALGLQAEGVTAEVDAGAIGQGGIGIVNEVSLRGNIEFGPQIGERVCGVQVFGVVAGGGLLDGGGDGGAVKDVIEGGEVHCGAGFLRL